MARRRPSGTQAVTVHPVEKASEAGAASFGDFTPRRGGTAQAALCPDIAVSLDAAVQTFQNEQGSVIYPIRMANVTYLPLRSIGELTGYEVSWEPVSGDPYHKGNIYLRTALSDSEKTALTQYADTMLAQIIELDTLVTSCTEEAFVTGADGAAVTTLTKPELAAQAIPQIKAKAQEIQALGAPSGTLLQYDYGRISAALDGVVQNADAVLAAAQQGEKLTLGGAADLSRDQAAVAVFNSRFHMRVDAERMKQMVTQKMA